MDPVTVILKTPPQPSSPRPSPAARQYIFAPNPNSKTPRAWERKPSTPFAPRNESQKIWKRYEFRDTNLKGTLQVKITETRAIKKLRLEGQEIAPYVTSWDEEIHETRHKQSENQNHNAITLPWLADPSTTTHNVGSRALTIENEGLATLPIASQNTEDQDAANYAPAAQKTGFLLIQTPSLNHQDIQRLNPPDASTQAAPLNKSTMAEQPRPRKEEALTEQNLDKKLAELKSVVSPQVRSLAAGREAINIIDDATTKELEELPVQYLTRDDTTNEKWVSPKQSTDQATACQLDASLEESLMADPAPGQHQKATTTVNQPSPLQVQIRNESVTPNVPNEAHGKRTRNDFAQQLRNAEPQHHYVILPAPVKESNTAGALCQSELENTVPELVQEERLARPETEATEGMEKKIVLLESPLGQDLLPHAQNPPSKGLAFAQDEDTDYLHAFLTRAKAKKAAREASPQKVDRVPPSPMTRSRAALVPLSTNSPSPKKANKPQMQTAYGLDVSEANRTSSPCRRSGRTRLPRPQKAPAVPPSTIPVRRSNGTEFVFLQSTDIAQVALATRANTKRNKGEAVMPKLKLQTMTQVQRSPSKSPRPRKGKEVSWKDEPTYFGMQADNTEEVEEKVKGDDKPRTRKSRRPGGANGTPAPKKVMPEEAMEVRTPVPRKRAKVKR